MPFVPVPNTALVEVRMQQDLQLVENTLYFRFPSPPAEGVLSTLATNVASWWVNEYAPLVVQAVTLREILVTDLTTATGPQATFVPPTLTQGENLQGGLANSLTMSISFRTANRGRSFRGRNYIVGLSISDINGTNTVKPTTIQAFITAYEGLHTVANDSDAVWVVVSRFSGVNAAGKPIPRATGLSTEVTTVVIVDNVLDNQRRRLPKRGQ